jgi:primase-polymerase (primpol)-like protein
MEIPPKPEVLPVIPENIPAELTALDHWVLSRATWKAEGQKWDKPPLQISGKAARANDPSTWVSFKVAYFHYRLKEFDYIGFVPTEADGLVFLDLDCVVNPDGTLGTWSPELRSRFSGAVPGPAELIAQLGTYAELSPSGRGVRIVCKGSLPEGRRKIGGKGNGCPDGFEMYSALHYLTITGQRLTEAPPTVTDCTEKLAALHAAVFGKVELRPATIPGPLPVTFLDDLAVIEKASHSKGGERFVKLWNGNASGYASRSEADFCPCWYFGVLVWS